MARLYESDDAYVNYHPPTTIVPYGTLSLLAAADGTLDDMAIRPLQAKMQLVDGAVPTWKAYYVPCTTCQFTANPGEVVDLNFSQEITADNWTADTGYVTKRSPTVTAPTLLIAAFARIALGTGPYTKDKGWVGKWGAGGNFDSWIHHWTANCTARWQNTGSAPQTLWATGFLSLSTEDSNVTNNVPPVVKLEPPNAYSEVTAIVS